MNLCRLLFQGFRFAQLFGNICAIAVCGQLDIRVDDVINTDTIRQNTLTGTEPDAEIAAARFEWPVLHAEHRPAEKAADARFASNRIREIDTAIRHCVNGRVVGSS